MTPTRGQRHYARHRDRVVQRVKDYRAANPEKVKASQRASHAKRHHLRRQYEWQKKYGLSLMDFSALWAAQSGACGVCPTELITLPWKHIHVDHDHVTGRVRGLLCHGCNLAIGHMKDNPDLLRRAAAYVEK